MFIKNQLVVRVWVCFLVLCSVPLVFFSILPLVPHLITTATVNLEVGRLIHPILFFFKIVFTNLVPLPSHINFRIIIPSIYKKILTGILIEIVLYLYINFEIIHSLLVHEHSMSLHLLSFFHCFHQCFVVTIQVLHVFC